MRGWRFAGAAFCCLMLALHAAAGYNSAGVADFWRDMYWATSIAYGERFPLSGPPINNLLELGPWWFYLLAVPLWLTHSVAAASVFVQLLASAKYVLAWRLGTRMVDARFGLALAVSTAIAGWSTAAFWFPSHPALTETALLLLAFATWRCWNAFTLGSATLFGLAAMACLHAHPTTALYVAIGGAALVWRHRSWRSAGLLGLSALIVCLSVLPPLLDSSVAVPNVPTSFASYARDDFGVDFFHRIPLLLRALLVGGAWIGFLTMTKWSHATAALAWWAYCACLVVAGAGVLLLRAENGKLRTWFALSICLLLMQVVFLALVRHFTSIWMVPSCLPPLSFAIATGWYGWFVADSRARRFAGLWMFALYAALVVVPFGLFLREMHTLRVMNTNPFFNISDTDDNYTTVAAPVVSVHAMDRIAAALCEPATLHLRLAAIVEATSAAALRNACGRWPDLRFAGRGEGVHLAGLPASAAAALGIVPDRVVAGMAFYSRVRAIAPAVGARVAGLRRMEVARRPPSEAQPTPNVLEFDTGSADVVGLTNRYPQFAPLTLRLVTVDGAPAMQAYADGKTFAYRCSVCPAGGRAHWRIEFDGVMANLDVVALIADADKAKHPSE